MKILYTPVVLFFVCITNIVTAQSPPWLWVKNAGDTLANSYATAISTDASGNSYATGIFATPTITFGNTVLTNTGFQNIFVTKYDASGNVLWAAAPAVPLDILSFAIHADNSGNSYVTGWFAVDTLIFGGDTLIPSGFSNFFLLKYDPAGRELWARGAVGVQHGEGTGISTDSAGNCYVTGNYQSDTLTFGNYTLLGTLTGNDIFIVKYDPAGNALWAEGWGGNNDNVVNAIATAADGSSYITGSFGGPQFVIGNDTLTTPGNEGVFVVKFDAGGNALWASGTQGNGNDNGNGISLDTHGNSYITGDFSSTTIAFGSTTLTNAGSQNIFIAKYDTSGQPVWANASGGTAYDLGEGITTTPAGISYITGTFQSPSVVIGNDTLTNNGGTNFFVAEYDTAGNPVWADMATGTPEGVGNGIGTDAYGNVYVDGFYSTPGATFGNFTFADTSDITETYMFIAKIGTTAVTQIADSICAGTTYNFNGQQLDTTGVYTDTLTGSIATDSIVILTLTVKPVPAVSLSWQAMVQADELRVLGNDTTDCAESSLDGIFLLFGGNPTGGLYSGIGVSGDTIYPYRTHFNSDTITYTITVNGCTVSAWDSLRFSSCEGLPSITLQDAISLYPNPITDILTMQSNLFLTNKVTPIIYDITGKQVVIDYTRHGDTFTFTTTSLAAGVYLVSMNVDGNEVVKRFVKLN